ncbi:hypothetical protein Tco_0472274 [Tanacetum coccineum]
MLCGGGRRADMQRCGGAGKVVDWGDGAMAGEVTPGGGGRSMREEKDGKRGGRQSLEWVVQNRGARVKGAETGRVEWNNAVTDVTRGRPGAGWGGGTVIMSGDRRGGGWA